MSNYYWIGFLSSAPFWVSLGIVIGAFFAGAKKDGEALDDDEAQFNRAVEARAEILHYGADL